MKPHLQSVNATKAF